jgi:hypothetical protein
MTNDSIKTDVENIENKNNELDRISIEHTKTVKPEEIVRGGNDDDLSTYSKDELEYKLEFEDLDKETKKKILNLIKSK